MFTDPLEGSKEVITVESDCALRSVCGGFEEDQITRLFQRFCSYGFGRTRVPVRVDLFYGR